MPSTYNPILAEERSAKRTMFQHREAPAPGVALVVHREGRPLVLLSKQTDRITAGEAWWGGIKTIYRVDISDHKLEFSCDLPCESFAFTFAGKLQFTCKVKDPVAVVERRITDATETLEKVLTDAMRDVSRQYRVDHADEAELAIRAALVDRERQEGFSRAFGITDIVVQLQLEQGALDHVRRIKDEDRTHERTLKGLIRQKEVEISRAEVEAERDRLKGERTRLLAELDKSRLQGEAEVQRTHAQLTSDLDLERDRLKGERERAQAKLESAKVASEGKLQMERAKIEAELKRHEATLTADLKRQEEKLEIERLEMYAQFYAPLIERGDWGLLALQLARSSDPETIANVVRMVREQRETDLDRQLSTLRLLLEQDALEGAQIAHIASEGKQLLERLIKSWGRSDGEPRALPSGDASGASQQTGRQPEGGAEPEDGPAVQGDRESDAHRKEERDDGDDATS